MALPDEKVVAFMGYGPDGSTPSNAYPGIVTKALWDSRTDVEDFMTAGGIPLVDGGAGYITDNLDGTFNVEDPTVSSYFNAGMIGMYMVVTGSMEGEDYVDHYFEILGYVDADNITVNENPLGGVAFMTLYDGDEININIGGACSYTNIQAGFDALQDVSAFGGGSESVEIELRLNRKSNSDPILLTTKIDIDAIRGALEAPINIVGVDEDYEEDGSAVTFKANASMATTGLFDVNEDYLYWRNPTFSLGV